MRLDLTDEQWYFLATLAESGLGDEIIDEGDIPESWWETYDEPMDIKARRGQFFVELDRAAKTIFQSLSRAGIEHGGSK